MLVASGPSGGLKGEIGSCKFRANFKYNCEPESICTVFRSDLASVVLSLVGSSLVFYQWAIGKGQRRCAREDGGVIKGAGGHCFQKINFELCRIDIDSDSYFKESSDAEEKVAGSLRV